MNSLINRSTALAAVAIASLLAAAPARAQSDERAIVAAITKFLDGIRTRDTTLMRAAVVAGATLVPVGGPTGLGAPSTIDAVIDLIENRDLFEDEYHDYIVGYICKVINRRRDPIIAQLKSNSHS